MQPEPAPVDGLQGKNLINAVGPRDAEHPHPGAAGLDSDTTPGDWNHPSPPSIKHSGCLKSSVEPTMQADGHDGHGLS